MATDDEIIRRRLLIDGEGTGDARRITTLLKTFLKWCNSSSNEDESVATYQKIMAQLAQCEFAVGKTLMAYEMNEHETQNYENIYSEIEQSIMQAHEEIATCKSKLHQAKRIRRNRQEYDALAKVIEQHPERQETTKYLAVEFVFECGMNARYLRCDDQLIKSRSIYRNKPFRRQTGALCKDLSLQSETKDNLAAKLEMRQKQFFLLITTIHELQEMLNEDKAELLDETAHSNTSYTTMDTT